MAAQTHTVLPDISAEEDRMTGVWPHDEKRGWGIKWRVSTDSLLPDKTQKYWPLE